MIRQLASLVKRKLGGSEYATTMLCAMLMKRFDSEMATKLLQVANRVGDMIASEKIAKELVLAAKDIVAAEKLVAKKEVPEAFKKQWKNKDKDGDGKENEPKPDFLKDKEKKSSRRARLTARSKTAADFPYASLIFGKNRVEFRIGFGPDGGDDATGAEPYGRNVPRAIARVFNSLKMHKVSDQNVEVIA